MGTKNIKEIRKVVKETEEVIQSFIDYKLRQLVDVLDENDLRLSGASVNFYELQKYGFNKSIITGDVKISVDFREGN